MLATGYGRRECKLPSFWGEKYILLNPQEVKYTQEIVCWFYKYRNITQEPLPMVEGSMCELVLILDLVPSAELNYHTQAHVKNVMDINGIPPLSALIPDMETVIATLKKTVVSAFQNYLKLAQPRYTTTTSNNHHHNTNAKCTVTCTRISLSNYEIVPLWSSPFEHLQEKKMKIAGLSMYVPPEMPIQLQEPLNKIYQWFSMYRYVVDDIFPKARGTCCEVILLADLVEAAILHYEMCPKTRESMDILSPSPFGALRPTLTMLRNEAWKGHLRSKVYLGQ
jgi:hypothetical protein